MLLSSQQSRSSLMLCRYRRLYNAAIKDRAVTYAWFFLMYLIHIAFCIWSAVSPPLPGANDWSHTGFIACIKAFHASKFVGVVYTIGGVFWALESLWSLWVLKTVCSTVDMFVVLLGVENGMQHSRYVCSCAYTLPGYACGLCKHSWHLLWSKAQSTA